MISDPAAEAAQGFGGYKMMLMMDPPQHTAFRKLIRSEFTLPVSADRTAARMNALAKQIVDAVIARGECDISSARWRARCRPMSSPSCSASRSTTGANSTS